MDGVKWVYLLDKVLPHRERDVHLLQPVKERRKELPLSAPFLGSFILLSRAGQGLLPHYCEMLKIYWKEIVLQNCWVMPKASRGEHDLQAPTEGHSWPACPEECFWFPMSDM